jgi:hypothetical protein
MDEKAANHGDRMKHALLLETLEGTREWPDVSYAETHAGAGLYRAGAQATKDNDEQYIRLLQAEVEQVQPPEGGEGPGVSSVNWLKDWWKVPDQVDTYPGSALTALSWLRKRRPGQFQIHLTEADKSTCERLRQSLQIQKDQARHGSFQDNLDWLIERDNLVLLIDPFGIVTKFGEDGRDCGLQRGQMDHDAVKRILDCCGSKERAIVHFWWSSGQAYKDYCAATSRLFEGWRSQQGELALREFHDNHNHRSTLFGIGCGAKTVAGLPGRKKWKKSWLRSVIYEKPRRMPN